MDAQFNEQSEDENEHNQAWPDAVINHSVEIEGIMNHLNNVDNAENNQRPGHKRQFTDVLSEALEREEVKGWLSPYLAVFSIGGGIGFAAGVSSKKMGKYMLKTGLGSLLIIQALSYKGYLSIDWENIKGDINSFMERKENENYVQFLIANIGPVLAGFGLGFHFS